jgi:hypothetical protein
MLFINKKAPENWLSAVHLEPAALSSLGVGRGKLASVLEAAQFPCDVLNATADPFHGPLDFILGHIEPFGPVP